MNFDEQSESSIEPSYTKFWKDFEFIPEAKVMSLSHFRVWEAWAASLRPTYIMAAVSISCNRSSHMKMCMESQLTWFTRKERRIAVEVDMRWSSSVMGFVTTEVRVRYLRHMCDIYGGRILLFRPVTCYSTKDRHSFHLHQTPTSQNIATESFFK